MASVSLAATAAGLSTLKKKEQRPSLLRHVKEALVHSAAAKSCRGKIRLHVLFSTPRLAKDLYPFAHVNPNDAAASSKASPVEAFVEHIIMTASYAEESQEQGRLMYALECFLYTLPKHRSSLLYVSKLDSSGWGPSPISKCLQADLIDSAHNDPSWDSSTSITRVITRAFLSYFASLSHWLSHDDACDIRHISIHILARSQGAYLFPSSNDNKGKHILSDGALIKWWRSIMSSVICGVRRQKESTIPIQARPFYVIPGYNRLESHELLPLPPPASTNPESRDVLPTGNQALSEANWVYGHPYSLQDHSIETVLPPLPLSGPSFDTSTKNTDFDSRRIAMLLPHFPDDPKSRFIAELAMNSYEHAAMPKRKINDNTDEEATKRGKFEIQDLNTQNEETVEGREEAAVKSSLAGTNSLVLKAMRERKALDLVSADEFWERMGFRQECCAGNAVGVFVGLFTLQEGKDEQVVEGRSSRTMQSQSLALHHPIVPELVRKHLMRDVCDWSESEGSRELTKAWDEGVERAVKRKGGLNHAEGVNQTEVGKDVIYADVTLQGPTEEQLVLAQEKWKANQGSSAMTSNGGDVASTTIVNTLNVKRKRKV